MRQIGWKISHVIFLPNYLEEARFPECWDLFFIFIFYDLLNVSIISIEIEKVAVKSVIFLNFRASGSVRRHCPLPFLLLTLSLVSLERSVVLSPSLCSPSSPSPQASLSSISLSLCVSL